MPPKHRIAADATRPESLTPHELVVFPELAVLAALQQLLALTTRTLAALHPDLVRDRSHPRPLDVRTALADQIIELNACLGKAAICYRVAAIDSLHAPDTDDIPF
jgi:hypothetical protein